MHQHICIFSTCKTLNSRMYYFMLCPCIPYNCPLRVVLLLLVPFYPPRKLEYLRIQKIDLRGELMGRATNEHALAFLLTLDRTRGDSSCAVFGKPLEWKNGHCHVALCRIRFPTPFASNTYFLMPP